MKEKIVSDQFPFKFVKNFRIDFMEFKLYTNEVGQFKTTILFTDSGTTGDPQIYEDYDKLCECFEDEFMYGEL